MSKPVTITEVGPRDGLQNEDVAIPTDEKVAFIHRLVKAGLRQIEVASFVKPERVPAMADAEAVFRGLTAQEGVSFIGLVPNLRGYDRARAVGCDAIAMFTAASDAFTSANINMTMNESLRVFGEIAGRAASDGVRSRGYVSTIFACPYTGPVAPERVLNVARELLAMGCDEVVFGDTTGVGTPDQTAQLLDTLLVEVPVEKTAFHFHDTWGMAIANIVTCLSRGIRSFDSSAGGLGGCPFAQSATGNVATEDLLYLLDGLGYDTGADVAHVARAVAAIGTRLGRSLPSKVHQAVLSQKGTSSCS
jgi:hydroxymethylglutaryl-CoA lyase